MTETLSRSPIKWRTESRSLSEIVPAEYNPRKLSDEQKRLLKESLTNFSVADPLILNSNNRLIGGHQRLKVLADLGIDVIDCRIPDRELTPDEERELNLRLNKNTGDWDYELLAKGFDEEILKRVGFTSEELDKIFAPEPTQNDDNVPDVQDNIYNVKRGDIWQLGRHRLMCGDSTDGGDVALLMDGKKADMVFTDPPYGVSYADKNKYLNSISPGNRIQTEIENDHKSVSDLQDKVIYPAFCRLKENIADNGTYYITAPQGGELLMMMMMMMMKAELTLRHMLVWCKNNHVIGRTDYNYKHEPILYGWINTHEFYGNGEHQFSTWEIPKPLKSDLHPTMKPVSLIVNACQNSTVRDNIVLDIFLGSGSTLIACEKTNRICYGIEISEHYCSVIIKRWEDFTGNKAQRITNA